MSSPINYEDEYSLDVLKDTIAIDSSTIPSLTSGPYPSMNVGVGSAGGAVTTSELMRIDSSGSVLTTNGTGNAMWTTSPYITNGTNWVTINNSNKQPLVQVKGDAEFEGKVKINGQDLGEFMETISKRLAILVPDPAKLEHFEALKKAYNHYKTLEALCELPTKETKE